MLNNSTKRTVYNALDDSPFGSASFECLFQEAETVGPILTIKFRDNNEFQFKITDAKDEYGRNLYQFYYSPAKFTKSSYVNDEFNKFSDFILKWCSYIKNELIASNPVYEDFEKFKQEINSKIEEYSNDPLCRFDDEEKKNLKSKLDELQNKFEELKRNHEITDNELSKVKAVVSSLTENLKDFPKKTWFRSAASKMYDMSATLMTSQAGQKILEQSANKLLNSPP